MCWKGEEKIFINVRIKNQIMEVLRVFYIL